MPSALLSSATPRSRMSERLCVSISLTKERSI